MICGPHFLSFAGTEGWKSVFVCSPVRSRVFFATDFESRFGHVGFLELSVRIESITKNKFPQKSNVDGVGVVF